MQPSAVFDRLSTGREIAARLERRRAVVDAGLTRPARWRGPLARELDGTTDPAARRTVAAAFDALADGGAPTAALDLPWLLAMHAQAVGVGELRVVDVRVGGPDRRALACAPHSAVRGLTAAALDRARSDRDPAPITAARLHLELVRIHPFDDGNGRVARLAATCVLMRAGYRSTLFTAVEQHARGPLAWHDACARLAATGDEDTWLTTALVLMDERSAALAALLVGGRGSHRGSSDPHLGQQRSRLRAEERSDARGRRARRRARPATRTTRYDMTVFTLRTSHRPATDLCRWLNADPDRVRSVALPFGTSHLFVSDATAGSCTVVVLVELDAIVPTDTRQYLTAETYVPSPRTVEAAVAALGVEPGGNGGLPGTGGPVELGIPVLAAGRLDVRIPARSDSLVDALVSLCSNPEPTRPRSPGRTGRPRRATGSATGRGRRTAGPARTVAIATRLGGPIVINGEQLARAGRTLRDRTRQALCYLPPTMAATPATARGGLLEHPRDACAAYRRDGADLVVCEEKHMGSRVVALVCRDERVARRLGARDGGLGHVWSRSGRAAFAGPDAERVLVDRLATAIGAARLWDELDTRWLALDCELLPWSAGAHALIRDCYEPLGEVARAAGSADLAFLHAARRRGVDVAELIGRAEGRRANAERFVETFRRYGAPMTSIDDIRLAPFQILAGDRRVHVTRSRAWHATTLARLVEADRQLLRATRSCVVDVRDAGAGDVVTGFWERITEEGGEGVVLKPLDPEATGTDGRLLQPALKCRGRDYLSLVFGPDYATPPALGRLRARRLTNRRNAARREFALGVEALERTGRGEGPRRVRECLAGIVALEGNRAEPML